jgi:hypothetical protein
MHAPIRTFRVAALAGAALMALSSLALASSHREAPFITTVPKVDATDFYMFASYEAGREGYVTLLANYQPLQDAYGGPNYFSMDPNALYEIHVDNNGDAREDLTFQFRFSNKLAGGTGVALPIGDKNVAIPLIQAAAAAASRPRSPRPAPAAPPSPSRSTTSASRPSPTTRATPRSTSTPSTCPAAACRPSCSWASARIRSRSTWARSSTS